MFRIHPRDSWMECGFAVGALAGVTAAHAATRNIAGHRALKAVAFIFASCVGSFVYSTAMDSLSKKIDHQNLRKAELITLGVGTLTTGAVILAASRVFLGSFVPSDKWGALQGLLIGSASRIYSSLNDRWLHALRTMPYNERLEALKVIDKSVALQFLQGINDMGHFPYFDAYGQNPQTTPIEVLEQFPLGLDLTGKEISMVTLNKLLDAQCHQEIISRLFRTGVAATQIEIIKRGRLPVELGDHPKLAPETVQYLLQNPSARGLLCICMQNIGVVEDNIEQIQTSMREVNMDEWREIVRRDDFIQIMQYFPRDYLFALSQKMLTSEMLHEAMQGTTSLTREDVFDLIKLFDRISPFSIESRIPLIEDNYRVAWVDQHCQREDVTQAKAELALTECAHKCNPLRLNQGLSEATVQRWKLPRFVLLRLAVKNSTVQQALLKEKRLCHEDITYHDDTYLYPCLAQETIDTVLGQKDVNIWELLICSIQRKGRPEKWDQITAADLMPLTEKLCLNAWKTHPLRKALDFIPSDQVIPLLDLLERYKSPFFDNVLSDVITQSTPLEPFHAKEWLRVYSRTVADVHRFIEPLGISPHAIEIIDEIACRPFATLKQLRHVVYAMIISHEKYFWTSSWDFSQLSPQAANKLHEIFKFDSGIPERLRCILHLVQRYPEMQIQMLNVHPLGPHYIYNIDDPSTDGTYFPTLHQMTLSDIMKRQAPTFWEIAFCARVLPEARARLSEFPLGELSSVSKWIEFWKWDHSLAKVVVESLTDEKLREATLGNVPWREFLLRRALERGVPFTDEELIRLANGNVEVARVVVTAHPQLTSRLQSQTQLFLSYEPRLGPAYSGLQFTQYRSLLSWRNFEFSQAGTREFTLQLRRILSWDRGTYSVTFESPMGDTPFRSLPRDILIKLCKMLRPTDLGNLASTSQWTFNEICTERGTPIWQELGSIGNARHLQQLANEIAMLQRSHMPDTAQITIRLLLQAWPKAWPADKRPQWIP